VNEEGLIEITNKNAINHPEDVNYLLVNAGYSPMMLKVKEEDLESYFLRIINQGDQQ
jgi:ABC-2 type transport system ATP-binding protein